MTTSQTRTLWATAVGCLLLLDGASARAQDERGARADVWQLGLGARLTRVAHRGFDPYANNDVLPQLSLLASRTVWSSGQLSFAPGVVWDYGESSADARRQDTVLRMHRIALSLEGRYAFLPGFYGTARLAPGALHQSVTITDPGFAPYVARAWAPAFEASLGAAGLLGPRGDESSRHVRFWIGGDVGYAYASSQDMPLHADLAADDPRRAGELDLGPLALRGGFARLYGAMTF